VFTAALHAVLLRYADQIVSVDPASIYTLRPGPMFWYVPAAFLGCVLAGVAVHLLNRMMLPGGAREFREYGNVKAGLRATRMFACFGIVFLGFGLFLSYFAAATVVHLRPNDLVVHRLWSFEDERYPYSKVQSIREVHDEQRDTNDFEIAFDQAELWTTRVEVIFFDETQKAFLSEHTGKSIQYFISR